VSRDDDIVKRLLAGNRTRAATVCRSPIVLQAWRRGQEIAVHAWIHDLTKRPVEGSRGDPDSDFESTLDAAIERPPPSRTFPIRWNRAASTDRKLL
jgi:hypothetical protein